MTSKQLYELATQLPDVSIKDHFGSDGFSANKRMFLTIWHDKNKANIRLSPENQREFLISDEESFAEIDNAWGRQGWTSVHLKFIDRERAQKALELAWQYSAQKNVKAKTAVRKKRPLKIKNRSKNP